jgi:predicted transcriptional regulator
MGSFTIQVDAEVAKAYQEINSTNRKRIEMLFNILVQKELKEISLMQIMDNIGYQAEKNGLTPEILESILADED